MADIMPIRRYNPIINQSINQSAIKWFPPLQSDSGVTRASGCAPVVSVSLIVSTATWSATVLITAMSNNVVSYFQIINHIINFWRIENPLISLEYLLLNPRSRIFSYMETSHSFPRGLSSWFWMLRPNLSSPLQSVRRFHRLQWLLRRGRIAELWKQRPGIVPGLVESGTEGGRGIPGQSRPHG